MQPSSQRPARLEPTSSRKNRRTFLSCRLFGPESMPPPVLVVEELITTFVSHEAAMQPFFKLRLACAISTLPTTQAPRRLYYAARAGYVGAIKKLLAHGASATKVPVVAKRVKRRRCLEHPE